MHLFGAIKINKVVRTLIVSDFFLQAGWGFTGPIFAIFLTKQIQDGSLQVVGLAVAAYWLIKSVVQPFFAYFLDKTKGERDDFIFLILGMVIANLIPFGYIFANFAWQIYFLEIVRGLAMAWVVPAWSAIFTRHIDKGKEAFSWSIESTGIGIGAGIAGALGAFLASRFGFQIVFVLTAVFGLFSTFVLWAIKGHLFGKEHFRLAFPFDKPR